MIIGMRDDIEIKSIISMGEGKTVEFKQDLTADPKRYVSTAVAFANSTGGIIFFGVSDDGEIVGISEDLVKDRMEQISYNIGALSNPIINYSMDGCCIDGKHLVIVEVFPGILRPYRLADGTVYIRQGRNTFKACDEKIQELMLEHRGRSFDAITYYDDGGDGSIDPNLIDGILKTLPDSESGPATIDTLISMGLLKEVDGKLMPTMAFELLTRNRERYELSCALFKGTEKVDFLDRREYSGNLLEQIREAVSFVERNMKRRAVIDGLYRKDIYDIPLEAIRESVVNAILHRSYVNRDSVTVTILDDRIEVESPGVLMIRPERLGTGLYRTRNEVLARYFRNIGVTEVRGTGITRMRRACREQGLREPLIEEIEDHVRVTFFKTSYGGGLPALGSQERRMLEIMALNPDMKQDEIAEILGVSKVYVSKLVRNSKDRGVLSRDNSRRKGGWEVDLDLLGRL